MQTKQTGRRLLLGLTKVVSLVGLAASSALGQSTNQITAVSPATAAQGTANLLVTFALDTDVPPAPPAGVLPTSVSLGTLTGSAITHASQYAVTALFTIPAAEAIGTKDATIVFSTPNGTLTFSKTQAFQVTAGAGLAAAFSSSPATGIAPLEVHFTDASTGTVTSRLWDFGDGATSTASSPSHTYTTTGSFSVSLTVTGPAGSDTLTKAACITTVEEGRYPVVDTAQTGCYNASTEITAPAPGQAFYGQDAQLFGNQPSYSLSADGLSIHDNNTGLTWQRSPDTNGDGSVTYSDKLTYAQAQAYPAALNAGNFGGYNDWRLPSIKELYSLMDFRGTDPSGDSSGQIPFIDTAYFTFSYGFTSSGERAIDSQWATRTTYVADASQMFGVNFADGRIKGYGITMAGGSDKVFFVICVRGNPAYGINVFVDNGDQTVTDRATGLMWTKADSGSGMNWADALAYAQTRNAAIHLGYNDWRLPNAKELQSIVDYTRSPDTSASAAIDPVFTCTQLLNEEYQTDYPWYWTGTTHVQSHGSAAAGAYVCFGRSLGYMTSSWVDIHGAGCQRSDPKSSLAGYTQRDNGYYNAIAPQGDAVRLYNYVRLVRGGTSSAVDHVGDGISDAWRRQYFGGSGLTVDSDSAATADPDHDGKVNSDEYLAGTHPLDSRSRFEVESVSTASGFALFFQSSANRRYTLYRSVSLASDSWSALASQTDVPGTGGVDFLTDPAPTGSAAFYRIAVEAP